LAATTPATANSKPTMRIGEEFFRGSSTHTGHNLTKIEAGRHAGGRNGKQQKRCETTVAAATVHVRCLQLRRVAERATREFSLIC
jgi:hypothetical protein